MLFVRKLIWDTWNIQHIKRHHIIPDEVEAVCHTDAIVLQGQQKKRLVIIGETEEKRLLAVVLEAKGHSTYYPITAYDADIHDRALYHRLRGGENDDTEKK